MLNGLVTGYLFAKRVFVSRKKKQIYNWSLGSYSLFSKELLNLILCSCTIRCLFMFLIWEESYFENSIEHLIIHTLIDHKEKKVHKVLLKQQVASYTCSNCIRQAYLHTIFFFLLSSSFVCGSCQKISFIHLKWNWRGRNWWG